MSEYGLNMVTVGGGQKFVFKQIIQLVFSKGIEFTCTGISLFPFSRKDIRLFM